MNIFHTILELCVLTNRRLDAVEEIASGDEVVKPITQIEADNLKEQIDELVDAIESAKMDLP